MSDFSEAEQAAVYRALYERRDIRAFRPERVPEHVLWRILDAAHHAGSVGFMQPWNFVLVRDRARRERLVEHVTEVSKRAADHYESDRRAKYLSLKLQGILDAPLGVIITCDPTRGGPHVLGRSTIRETDVYSACLAVQNFWLAARAEGIGAGWISILEPAFLNALFGMPEHIIPIAYMAVGYPVEFPPKPMLQRVGWRGRESLEPLVFDETWGSPAAAPSGEPGRTPEPPEASPDPGRRNEELTKPPGSLGRLEAVAIRLAALQGRTIPRCRDRALVLFAGDHGVVAERVSAYKPEVTAKMVYQFVAGGAAVNALARQVGLPVHVVDVGVDHDFGDADGVDRRKVRRGTRNLRVEAAMTESEVRAAIDAGRAAVESLPALDVLAVGEMGIGNSTATAALVGALLELDADDVVGRGTGVGDATLARKRAVVADALALHGPHLGDPTNALQRLGGLEIAALVGAIEAAADRSALVVLDGYITGAAALCAARRTPSVLPHLVAGHRSAEPGHARVLAALGLEPLLALDMRLGEGSGATLAVGLIDGAARVFTDMATFTEAGMEHPLEEGGRD